MEKQEIKELCKHSWEEIAKEKRVAGFQRESLFGSGGVWYEMRILQKCTKCGKQEVIKF